MIIASDKLKFLMYADDTTIYFSLEDFDSQNTEADMNTEIEKVNSWLKLSQLFCQLLFISVCVIVM